MQGPDPSRTREKIKRLGAFFVLGLLLLSTVLAERLPRASHGISSGSLYLAEAAAKDTPEDPSATKEKPRNTVIVYITSWCPACRMTTDYLKQKKIPFTVKDVEKNESYMREMVEKVGGYRGVPVLDINGKIFLGFNPMILKELTE